MQGAYLILAVGAVGLDAGGMGGFDNAKVDEEFFAGTTVKSNFFVNIGHGILSGIKGRAPVPLRFRRSLFYHLTATYRDQNNARSD